MRVSAVVPAFNAERFIRSTLESVLAQTYDDLEIIVVDDGSSDRTADAVAGMRSPRIQLVQGGRHGVSAARNEGIRRSSGELIAFIDHDDLWEPDKIRRQVEVVRGDARVGLVFTRALVERDGAVTEMFPDPDRAGDFLEKPFETLVHWNYIPMSAVMVTRPALAGLPGPFDTKLELAEDWDLWLRILARLEPGGVRFIPEPLTRYKILPGRATERMADLRLEDITILEDQLRGHPWLVRSDPARVRDTRYRLHQEAGYWLLREGRVAEARRALRRAWLLRPASFKPLGFLLTSYLGWTRALQRTPPCV